MMGYPLANGRTWTDEQEKEADHKPVGVKIRAGPSCLPHTSFTYDHHPFTYPITHIASAIVPSEFWSPCSTPLFQR